MKLRKDIIEGLDPAQSSWVREKLGYVTGGETPRPHIDLTLLSASEQHELEALVRHTCDHGVSLPDLSLLGSDASKFWALVAVAAGRDRDFYETARAEARDAAQSAERDAKKRQLPLTRKAEQSVFRTFWEALDAADLYATHIGILTMLLSYFAAGRPLKSAAACTFEGEGVDMTLVCDANLGLWGDADADDVLARTVVELGFLAQTGWIVLDRAGPTMRVRLGERLLAALDGSPFSPLPPVVEPEYVG